MMLHIFSKRLLWTLRGSNVKKQMNYLNIDEYWGFKDAEMFSNYEVFKNKYANKQTKVLGVGAL